MNQFHLATNHFLSAQYHCDSHVVKMPTEAVQQLCDNLRIFGYTEDTLPWLGKTNHPNHPVTIWARASFSNWQSTIAYGLAVAREYQYRYGVKKGAIHAAIPKLYAIRALDVTEHFGHFAPTPFPLCMPPECRIGGVVESYRRYYAQEKWHILAYRNGRKIPPWLIEEMKQC